MVLSSWKKVTLSVVGTILVGAIGSGVWDLIGKQTSMWLGHAFLTGITLGSVAVRDSIYKEAAKGLHEAGALQQFSFFVLLAACAAGGVGGYLDGRAAGQHEAEEYEEKLQERVSNLPFEEVKTLLQEGLAELQAKTVKRKMRFRWKFRFAGLLVCSFLLFNFTKFNEANRLYTAFAQSLTICSPYIDSHQKDLFNSKFAQIKGKNDYVSVMSDLQGIARTNHVEVPTLSSP